MDQEEEE